MNKEGHKPGLEFTGTEEINTQPETLEIQKEKRQVAKATLADIFRERAGFDTPLELRKLPESFENIQLPEIISANFEENLRLLHELNGHSGQQIIPLLWGKSEIAKYLKKLFNWSKSEAQKSSPDFAPLEQEPPEVLKSKSGRQLYELLKFLSLYPETLPEEYETQVNNRFLKAVGKNPEKHKLIDGLSALFAKQPDKTIIKRVLNEVGFIPRDVLHSKKFKDLEAPRVTGFINTLSQINSESRAAHNGQQEYEYEDVFSPELQLANVSNTERANLLNVLINSPQIEHLRKKRPPLTIELDCNGIYIKGANFDFGSHIPFGLIEPETLRTLENKFSDLLNEHELLEAKLRHTINNGNYNEYFTLSLEQLVKYAEAIGWKDSSLQEFFKNDPAVYHKIIGSKYVFELRKNYNEGKLITTKRLIIPDLLIKQISSQDSFKSDYQKQRLIATAEELTMHLTDEETTKPGLREFGNPALLNQTEQSYKARERVVNTPGYYNIAKIGRFYLQNPPRENGSGILTLRGKYHGESKDQGHEFLEVIAGENVHRILINPSKHLSKLERRNFEKLRAFSQKDFSNLEDKLKVYETLTYSISAIATIARNWIRYDDLHGYYVDKGKNPEEIWENNRTTYLTACENFLAFTRANLGKKGSGTENLYTELESLYKKLKALQRFQLSRKALPSREKFEQDKSTWDTYTKQKPRIESNENESLDEHLLQTILADSQPLHPWDEQDACKALCGLVEKIAGIYEAQLYKQIAQPGSFKEKYRSEIHVSQQKFDSEYFKSAKKLCEPGGYHKGLCECGENVRVVQIEQKNLDTAELISIETEEEALRAIHYNRDPDRFTVIVYGGARNMERNRVDDKNVPQEIFHFLNAREKKGNIICPGTQVGIGITFALMNTDHQREYSHLPENRRVFAMAISPAPNIIFNGNRSQDLYRSEEKFAMSPIPTIALDLPAGWHIWGAERENIPYAKLSARSADLIARASFNQDRIISFSNGGLFSLYDTHASIRHNIPLLIHDLTGRSAEALAALVKNKMLPNTLNPEEYWPKALECLTDTMREESRDYFFQEDFGTEVNPQNENHILYRKVLFPLLLTLNEKQKQNPNFITITQPEDTQKTLNAVAERMAEARKARLELAKQKKFDRE